MLSNYLILCHPLLLPWIWQDSRRPSIWVFSNESALPSGGQSIGVSASASVLPMNIQGWFPLGLTRLNSLQSKGLSRVPLKGLLSRVPLSRVPLKGLLQHHSLKALILWCSTFFMTQLSHPYMTTGKTIALTIWSFVSKMMSLLYLKFIYLNWRIITLQHCDGFCHIWKQRHESAMSLLFNTLLTFVIVFLPSSKGLLILWLQSQFIVILQLKRINSATASTFSPSFCHEVMGTDAMILIVLILSFKETFHSPLASSSKVSLVPLHILPLECEEDLHMQIPNSGGINSLAISLLHEGWGCWYFSWQSWFQLVSHPFWHFTWCNQCNGLPWWLSVKESPANAGDVGLIPGSGRSPRVGNGNPLQYSKVF